MAAGVALTPPVNSITIVPMISHLIPRSMHRGLAAAALALAPWLALAQQASPAPAPVALPAGLTMVGDLAPVPPPNLTASAWLTLDVNSNQIIAASNPEQKVEPASLTKLM